MNTEKLEPVLLYANPALQLFEVLITKNCGLYGQEHLTVHCNGDVREVGQTNKQGKGSAT